MEKISNHIPVELDGWRESIELPPISTYLKDNIQTYFQNQDFTIYIPGRHVIVQQMPVDLLMVLITFGKSHPYKVFYRFSSDRIEVFLIRHPHQQPLE